MASRQALQTSLTQVPGVTKVYFQAPSKDKMTYPCIVYNIDDIDVKYGDDQTYTKTKKYLIQVIDKNPDSAIPDYILDNFKMCSFDRFFVADNLNHFNLTLFY